MDHDKMMELLMQIVQDMSFVKAKLEAKTREQERVILSLERKINVMEETARDDLVNSKKQQTSVFISMGIAVFSALLSFLFNLL